MQRRTFLELTLCGTGCALAGSALTACGDGNYTFSQLGEPVTIRLADYPALTVDGGFVELSRQTTGFSYPIFVRNRGGVLVALSGECSHEGCAVSASGTGFRCPCHGAQFDADGRVTAGPADVDMLSFDVNEANGEVVIG
jgi:Rieske Fe-S protein